MGTTPPVSLSRRLAAELVGTMLLVACVVGSGILGAKLSGGNDGIALLANSIATAGALVALILALGPISGAYLNPIVTALMASMRAVTRLDATYLIVAQVAGGLSGTVLAHAMFGLPLAGVSSHHRSSVGEVLGEIVATFFLVGVLIAVRKHTPRAVPFAVAATVLSAYWFTSSTSFANPAVTIARALTDTFAGIAPTSVPAFLLAQVLGATFAALFFGWLLADGDERRRP